MTRAELTSKLTQSLRLLQPCEFRDGPTNDTMYIMISFPGKVVGTKHIHDVAQHIEDALTGHGVEVYEVLYEGCGSADTTFQAFAAALPAE